MPIKLLRDYTGVELEQLQEAEVSRIIDLECAEAGVPFALEHPGEYKPLPKDTDVVLYQIGHTGLLVQDRKEAEQLAEYLRQFELWTNECNWQFGYEPVAQHSMDKLEIVRVDGYSLSKMKDKKDAIARDKELKERHDKAVEAYSQVLQSRGRVSESVWKIVHAAWDFKEQRESLIRELNRYVELAEGDGAIGLRFFQKARQHSKYFRALIINGSLVLENHIFQNPENELDGSRALAFPEEVVF